VANSVRFKTIGGRSRLQDGPGAGNAGDVFVDLTGRTAWSGRKTSISVGFPPCRVLSTLCQHAPNRYSGPAPGRESLEKDSRRTHIQTAPQETFK